MAVKTKQPEHMLAAVSILNSLANGKVPGIVITTDENAQGLSWE
jgi:hypothetical protein